MKSLPKKLRGTSWLVILFFVLSFLAPNSKNALAGDPLFDLPQKPVVTAMPNTDPVKYTATIYFKASDVTTVTKASIVVWHYAVAGQQNSAHDDGSLGPFTLDPVHTETLTFGGDIGGLDPGTNFSIKVLRQDGSEYNLLPLDTNFSTPGNKAADLTLTNPIQHACQDGIDNDADSKIDFPTDPGCTSVIDDNENDCEAGEGGYCLLAPLPGIGDTTGRISILGINTGVDPITGHTTYTSGLGDYLLAIIRLVIGICGVLAVIMIVLAGVQYMTTDAISGKEGAKEKITHSLFGLVLAIGAYIILNTINPQLISLGTHLGGINLTVDQDLGTNVPVAPGSVNAQGEGVGKPGGLGGEITLTLENGGTVTLAACDTDKMKAITAFGKSVVVYQGITSYIQQISDQNGSSGYAVHSIGGYNCRAATGNTKWSAHAYGLAIDINPDKNPYSAPGVNHLTTDMPTSFRNLFTAKGFGWGGNWNNLKDPMHFSKVGSPVAQEQGNMIVAAGSSNNSISSTVTLTLPNSAFPANPVLITGTTTGNYVNTTHLYARLSKLSGTTYTMLVAPIQLTVSQGQFDKSLGTLTSGTYKLDIIYTENVSSEGTTAQALATKGFIIN